MDCIFQLLSAEDGLRSMPFEQERVKFAELLAEHRQRPADMVLVLAEKLDDDGEWRISTAPLMTVEHFCSALGVSYEPLDMESVSNG